MAKGLLLYCLRRRFQDLFFFMSDSLSTSSSNSPTAAAQAESKMFSDNLLALLTVLEHGGLPVSFFVAERRSNLTRNSSGSRIERVFLVAYLLYSAATPSQPFFPIGTCLPTMAISA